MFYMFKIVFLLYGQELILSKLFCIVILFFKIFNNLTTAVLKKVCVAVNLAFCVNFTSYKILPLLKK